MKRLVIASVFGPSPQNDRWYALQKQFIRKCTDVPFDYWVVLNGASPAGFEAADVALVNEENQGRGDAHAKALMQILDLFRQRRGYQAYLILDSDAFPVKQGWYRTLIAQMDQHGKQIAAPVRAENLDVFPHPSAFLIRDAVLDDPRLDFRRLGQVRNLLDRPVSDVGCMTQTMSDILFPLMRSNVVNVHPVAAAVYHHLFYHHGCGSRDFHFRVTRQFAYCEHWYDVALQMRHGRQLYRALMRDPEGFVEYLMGRNERLILPYLTGAVPGSARRQGRRNRPAES